MKENKLSFGEKFIETPSLQIKKNIMTWEDTMIQLSNVSYISAANIEVQSFPIWAAIVLLVGLLLLKEVAVLALVLIAVGCVWVYSWYKANEKRKQGAILNIRMNSGHNLYFTFERKDFLLKVLAVLERIIIDGGTNNQITINITDSTISGQAKVLNDLNI